MWILPSRGRPHNVARLAEAWRETAHRVEDVWVIRLDSDDSRLGEYMAMTLPPFWQVVIGERIGPCRSFNEMFALRQGEPFYGVMADDVVPETDGWDEILVSEAGLDGLAYGDDSINGEALATHPVVGGDFARRLGWLSLPGLVRLYQDNALTEAARAAGVLRYRPDVKLTHWHPANGRARKDVTHLKPTADADRRVFERWLRGG